MTGKMSQEARRAHALVERRRLIKRLLGSELPEARALADVLVDCDWQHPCRSAACPVCGIDFQRAAVAFQEQVIGIPARAVRNRKHALTIVPSEGCVPPDGLTLPTYLRVRAEIEAAMAACDLPPSLGAVDVSFNEDLTGQLPAHVSIHSESIGFDLVSQPTLKLLRTVFPATCFVSKPVHHQSLDYEDEALLYAFKPERVRRVTEKPKVGDDGKARRPEPNRRQLRPWQSVKLALVEHAAGYRGRLIGHKIDQSALEGLLGAFEWPRDGP